MEQSVISTSAVRCVGNTLVLHGQVYGPPFVVTAIGDARAMRTALDREPSVALFRRYVEAFGLGYGVEPVGDVGLPAYDGPLDLPHVQPPSWLFELNTNAKPFWALTQLFSNTLPSTSTRWPILSSSRFLTCHTPCQAVGRVTWLRRISMSRGRLPATLGSEPPNMITSCPPSRWLLAILYGPGPFQPRIAWESLSLLWQSARYESITALDAALATITPTAGPQAEATPS